MATTDFNRQNFSFENLSAADVICQLMAFHHITVADFAKHVAISPKQLDLILQRQAFMSVQVAWQVEQATGLKAKWLLQLDCSYQFNHYLAEDQAVVEKFAWAQA